MKDERIINTNTARAIRDHCIDRSGECDGCIYSIKHLEGDFDITQDCIFDNCPDSWRLDDIFQIYMVLEG